MNTWAHLARRFFGSLGRAEPPPADEFWVATVLTPAEARLWRRLSAADRRHAVAVARAVTARLDDGPAGQALRPVQAAALLHDVGKVEAGIGPLRRAFATVVAMVMGYERARGWHHRPGVVGRVGRYLCHDEIGADLLAQADSDPLTVAWAREHHLPQHRWSVPAAIGAALKAADDD